VKDEEEENNECQNQQQFIAI